jgi:hypothetical protein
VLSTCRFGESAFFSPTLLSGRTITSVLPRDWDVQEYKTLKKGFFCNTARLQKLPVKNWWNVFITTNKEWR